MLATAFIMSILVYISYHLGILNQFNRNPRLPIIFLLFLSVIIGTAISLFVAKKILSPITRFSEATYEVAKGNFSIQIDEDSPVTEIQDLAKNFNLMVHELSSIETLRNDFIVNVSHEFKTPIATIEGYATLLQGDSLSQVEYMEYTRMIIHSAKQLNALSSNILNLSKLENQEIVLEKTLFRLDEQIRQGVLMLEPEWNLKNIELQIDLIKTDFYGNEGLLMQVWLNLIGNAIKFTPENGLIQISLIKEEENMIFKIVDTGVGIDDFVIDHIFDKFYQGDLARKTEGNGLGLALVKRIVDLSKGRIKVESSLNKGSTFLVILPIEDPAY